MLFAFRCTRQRNNGGRSVHNDHLSAALIPDRRPTAVLSKIKPADLLMTFFKAYLATLA